MPHSKFSSSSRKAHSLLLSSLLASLPCLTTLVSQGLTNAALAQTNGPVAQVMPKQFLERYYQGVTYFKAGDLDKALAAFRAVVISAPYDPMVHLSLAAVLHQSGDLENAIAATNHADLDQVYGNLLRGSRNHLRAFAREIERQGGVYEAQYIDQEIVDAIIDSPMERGK